MNFKKSAQDATTTSALMAGRTKIDTQSIISEYPAGINVVGIDFVSTSKGNYFIGIFSEDATKFFNGGSVFNTIAQKWAEEFGGDFDTLNKELQAEGGVRMVFKSARSKDGRNYTAIDII